MSLYYRSLPNQLTLLRIILIPFFIIAFYLPFAWAPVLAGLIFVLAAVTDWFDGYLARQWQVTSHLGAFLDPVADKLLVASALVLLAGSDLAYLTIPIVVIVGREIAISALREWMAKLGKHHSVAVNVLGKIKTIIQMVAIVMLILITHEAKGVYLAFEWLGALTYPFVLLITWLAYILIYAAMLITLWSMLMYSFMAWREVKQSL